jgi:transcription initiation factor TFIID subunit 1
MLLYGIGDPTSGHGGLNYIKKPLKARGEKG